MQENPNQPRGDDAVLGSQAPTPTDSVVLGGIESVKQRWLNIDVEQRITAIYEALNYGDVGLDIVIQALQDESNQVKCTAYSLLQKREELRAKQVLKKYNPWQEMTCLRTLEGHSDSVRSVAISPDGQTIASGSEDETIRVLDLQSGEIKNIMRHGDPIHSITISSKNQIISRGNRYDGFDNIIKLWDLQTGQFMDKLDELSFRVFSIAVTPEGNTLVAGSENCGINVWDLPTKQIRYTIKGHSKLAHSLAISPNGKILVSGSQDQG